MTRDTSAGADRDGITLAISLAIILLAVVVLVGWHAHIHAAVQVFPGLIPTQYNSALCFMALGAAGIGLSMRRPILLLAGGSVAAVMGGAVILEYAIGASFGIDTLFFFPVDRTLSADPGRMALTTAVSFFLAGIALAVLAVCRRAYGIFGIVNAVPLGLALTSLIGYSFQITYVLPFSLGSQMALLTAVALLAYGVATLRHAWRHGERGPDGLPKWSAGISVTLLPVLFVAAGVLSPNQSWRSVWLDGLLSLAGVAVITLAVVKLSTAKVAYKGLLMFAVPLILLLTFVGFVVRARNRSESARISALRSSEVIGVSQSLLTHIAEAESAVRGYVITGDAMFATGYQQSLASVTVTTARLRALVGDNPRQEAHAARIQQLTAQRTGRFAEIFRLIKSGNQASAQEDVKGEIGPHLMAQVRAELTVFSQEEERLGAERRHLLDVAWQRLSWLLVAGTAAAILQATILTLIFSGGISRRLQQLRDNALSLAEGKALTPALAGYDEIADLDRVFHEMAASLDQASRRERANRILEGHHIDTLHAEALLKTGALQNAIFNSANFSSIATDAHGVIQIFNVGAERMLGYAAAEVMNTITPADISDPQELIARARTLSLELGTAITPGFEALVFKASRGIEDIYELTYIRKDGSRLPAVVSVTALRDAQDVIIGYLLIGTDNTARQQIEEERRKLDQRLRDQHYYTRSLIESNIDALMATDPRGVITDVNKQMEALTGCSRDELIGAPFKNCFTDAARAEAGINRVLNEGKVTNYELTARARDGRETIVSYNATTFRDRDRTLQGVFAAAHDMTELKLFERTLQQKNVELEDASRMKSEFLANMSHELRTPLNAIIGFSEVLRDGLIGEMTEQQRGFIGDIYSSGKHLLSLINDILDLSKVEAGKMLLDLEPVPLASLFANGLSIVREKAAARHIRLAVDAPEELGSIRADARKIKQIVYNLLSNALKFTSEGGHVTLRARRVARADVGRLSLARAGRSFPLVESDVAEFVEITVTDSGIGISAEGLARLFTPFSQIDSGLARRFEGTGLGLAMVKLLAELHGGSVAVESALNEGSSFTVWLPRRAVADDAPVPIDGAVPAPAVKLTPGPRLALVVEDDMKSADLIRVQLEAEGFTVLHAASGEAALTLAIEQPLSLITLDLMLPNMGGWEFLSRLKHLPERRRIPVVIISIVADRNKGFALGAAAVMQKPISRQELYESLADLGLLQPAHGHTPRVLVIDDDPKAVELIALRIHGLAGTVLRAYGGRDAIEAARKELPDLIVLDLLMPDLNGFDVVEALQAFPDTAGIPILVVTAKQMTADDRLKLNGCVTAIMEKAEFNRDRFTAEVRRAMAGRQRVA